MIAGLHHKPIASDGALIPHQPITEDWFDLDIDRWIGHHKAG
jgi:hypothetical protein